jgi:hypothetical protein
MQPSHIGARGLRVMERQSLSMAVVEIAACTAAAAHRRDHRHASDSESCHPHAIEVIRLGDRGVAVCHDCGADSGFMPRREAERMAADHQRQTLAASVDLVRVVAA